MQSISRQFLVFAIMLLLSPFIHALGMGGFSNIDLTDADVIKSASFATSSIYGSGAKYRLASAQRQVCINICIGNYC
jgi:hypothetical protein